MAFFEQKNPITIRRQIENNMRAHPVIPRKKNDIHINHQNISAKGLDIPDIFSHSIEKHKINISYNKKAQKKIKSRSQEKSFCGGHTNIQNKNEKLSYPAINDFSLSNVNYFPNKRKTNKRVLINSISVNNNNQNHHNYLKDLSKFQNKNLVINKSIYKNVNASTSLPKIKIKKNPLAMNLTNNNHKEIKETEKGKNSIIKEKRAVSQRNINYNIQNINMKSKMASKNNENLSNNNENNNSNENNNNNCNNNSQILLKDLLNCFYPLYQPAKHSENSFDNIASYGVNTYKGIIRQYNEDRVTILINATISKNASFSNLYKISYFSIYDGHAGNKCCEYLKTNLHQFIFDSEFFPQNPIKAIEEGFKSCENNFKSSIFLNNQYTDSSGSCACVILIINDNCYIANLGDSRALYSFEDGKKYIQLSRDHKPNDPIEKKRIYKAGGNIYRANMQLNENNSFGAKANESLVNLPYRIFPGRLSVSYFLIL